MAIKSVALLAIALLVGGFGVHGPKGNDTGGIIPWSRAAEATAFDLAQHNCSQFGKRALIRSVRRIPGDYIVYECRFYGPLRRFGPG